MYQLLAMSEAEWSITTCINFDFLIFNLIRAFFRAIIPIFFCAVLHAPSGDRGAQKKDFPFYP